MTQIMLELPQDVRERIEARSGAGDRNVEAFLMEALERYLENLETQEDEEDIAWIEAHKDEPTVSLEEALKELGLD